MDLLRSAPAAGELLEMLTREFCRPAWLGLVLGGFEVLNILDRAGAIRDQHCL